MNTQKKKIKVVPYDPNWPKIFETHAKEIKAAMGENVIEVHHIGSTSVPGLCAKPTVDIMCVVKDLKTVTNALENVGYIGRGEFNLPLRLFFSKRGKSSINLHIVNENHGEIEWNLYFQNYLRENEKARDMYAKVKLDLIKKNPDGFNIEKENWFSKYTIKKGRIILKLAKEARFNGYRIVIVSNENEIESFKKLLNLNEINFNRPNIFKLCLYKGVEVTAAAILEFFENSTKAKIIKIKALTDYDKIVLIEKIEEWMDFKEVNLIKEIF